MSALRNLLEDQGYRRIKMKFTKTNHFEVVAKINKIEGRFILDTGATFSCVGFEAATRFKLLAEHSGLRAAGAGETNMNTKISRNNLVNIEDWINEYTDLILFDITNVNEALAYYNIKKVDGIIGADILTKGKAIIDYDNITLYLKQ